MSENFREDLADCFHRECYVITSNKKTSSGLNEMTLSRVQDLPGIVEWRVSFEGIQGIVRVIYDNSTRPVTPIHKLGDGPKHSPLTVEVCVTRDLAGPLPWKEAVEAGIELRRLGWFTKRLKRAIVSWLIVRDVMEA